MLKKQEKEIYVVVSDLCNFSCAHCVNSSSPDATRWNMSAAEISRLATQITESTDITSVHFSGGEPTLKLPELCRLQAQIDRPINYAITTNGWFADRSKNLLDDLRLNELIISYDKFHKPFITPERIHKLIQYGLQRELKVSINFVFESLADLVEAEQFSLPNVTLHTTRLVRSGRALENRRHTTWIDKSAIHRTCPSFDLNQRRIQSEKIVYIPGQGLTPCCGPLAFNEQTPNEFIYSSTLTSYPTNSLRKALHELTFQTQALSCGLSLDRHQFQSACDACSLLYERDKSGVPSVVELTKNTQSTAYYPATAPLSCEKEELLLQKYLVAYVFTSSNRSIEDLISLRLQPNKPDSILAGDINTETQEKLIQFIDENYYQQFPEHYSARARQDFREAAVTYLTIAKGCKVYLKEGRITACLLTHYYDPHPGLKEPSLHIGYWGYDRGLLTADEVRWIKSDWISQLSYWSNGNRQIDASIDCFNTRALHLAKALGFKLRMLRLDEKT